MHTIGALASSLCCIGAIGGLRLILIFGKKLYYNHKNLSKITKKKLGFALNLPKN
jgi:uncharacterized YccA/Bax inhibitor family protein